MGRHRTAEEKLQLGERARAMRAGGRSRREIQAALGIGDDLATELLRGTQLPDTLRRPRAKDDYRAAAVRLRQQGQTYREIASELGVSKSSLSLWLRDVPHPTDRQRASVGRSPDESAQFPLRDPSVQEDRKGAARRMRTEGLLLREIANELGVSVKTVCLWCTGLPVPPRARHWETASTSGG